MLKPKTQIWMIEAVQALRKIFNSKLQIHVKFVEC